MSGLLICDKCGELRECGRKLDWPPQAGGTHFRTKGKGTRKFSATTCGTWRKAALERAGLTLVDEQLEHAGLTLVDEQLEHAGLTLVDEQLDDERSAP